MGEGENMYARINTKGIREPLVYTFKILDQHANQEPTINIYFSTKVPNPNEHHHDAVFHNVIFINI